MNFFDAYFTSGFFTGVQSFAIAILVLLVGWLIAKMIANGVEKALKKTKFVEKIISTFQESESEPRMDSSKVISRVVYYILLVVVFIVFFNILNLNMIANPLADLISTFLLFIPAVLKAAIILAFAYILGILAQWLVTTGSKKVNIDKLFVKLKVVDSEEKAQEYLTNIVIVTFYLILLLFISGVLVSFRHIGVEAHL